MSHFNKTRFREITRNIVTVMFIGDCKILLLNIIISYKYLLLVYKYKHVFWHFFICLEYILYYWQMAVIKK